MDNLLELKTGLPLHRVLEEPILKQFNINRSGDVNTATLIFADGQMYMLGRDKNNGYYKWIEFTRLKPEGIDLLEEFIRNEFMQIDKENFKQTSSQNTLFWESFIDNKANLVQVASGAYSSLPPVFKKIDDLINRFMYRLNEKIENKH